MQRSGPSRYEREKGYSLTPPTSVPPSCKCSTKLPSNPQSRSYLGYLLFRESPLISLGSTRFINKLRYKLSMPFNQILSFMKARAKSPHKTVSRPHLQRRTKSAWDRSHGKMEHLKPPAPRYATYLPILLFITSCVPKWI